MGGAECDQRAKQVTGKKSKTTTTRWSRSGYEASVCSAIARRQTETLARFQASASSLTQLERALSRGRGAGGGHRYSTRRRATGHVSRAARRGTAAGHPRGEGLRNDPHHKKKMRRGWWDSEECRERTSRCGRRPRQAQCVRSAPSAGGSLGAISVRRCGRVERARPSMGLNSRPSLQQAQAVVGWTGAAKENASVNGRQ
jgi:hypothetical protein